MLRAALKKKEDPPGLIKHLRLTEHLEDDVLEALKTFPTCYAVVYHAEGKKTKAGQENKHWHIWIELDRPLSNVAFKERLRKHSDVFNRFKGQEAWTSRNHTDFGIWSQYVMRNCSAQVRYQRDPDDTHPPLPPVAVPVVASASEASAISYTMTSSRIRKKAMKEQFKEFLTEKGWFEGCVVLEDVQERTELAVSELTDYWSNAFTYHQGSIIVQYVIYEFGDDEVKKAIRDINSRNYVQQFSWVQEIKRSERISRTYV